MTNEQLVECIQNNQNVQSHMLELWQQNSGYIAKIAMKYRGYEDIEDLKQQGYMGLCEAVRGYNPSEGVKFLSYASFWIKQSMRRYIEECSRLVRIPSGTGAHIESYKKLTAAMLSYYGRRPTDQEACAYMGISDSKLGIIKQGLQFDSIRSIDVPIGEDDNTCLYELIQGTEDTENTIVDSMQMEQLKEILWNMVAELPQDEQEVIKLKYQDNQTMKEIADTMQFDSSQDAVNIHAKAINELQRPHRRNKLRILCDEYIDTEARHATGVAVFNRTWTSATERTALKLMQG